MLCGVVRVVVGVLVVVYYYVCGVLWVGCLCCVNICVRFRVFVCVCVLLFVFLVCVPCLFLVLFRMFALSESSPFAPFLGWCYACCCGLCYALLLS